MNSLLQSQTPKKYARSSPIALYLVVLMCLLFRPSITYWLAEPVFVGVIGFTVIYLLLGKSIYLNRRKAGFLILIVVYFAYIILQGLAFGTANLSIILREIGFVFGPVAVLLMMNKHTWPAALKAVLTSVLIFLPSCLLTGLLSLLPGMAEHLVIDRFILDMGDATYQAVWSFPYTLSVGGIVEFGPVEFRRATGFVREPGIYQILIIISYFAVDILKLRHSRLLKGLLGVNLFLTFSTAGWGAFAASWIYYNVLARGEQAGSTLRSFGRRIGALLLFMPVGYLILFGESKASVTEKLAGASGQVRLLKALDALESFVNNPVWGIGFQSPEVNTIHFIGVLAQIGLVGVLLAFSFIILPNLSLIWARHRVLVLLISPVLTTVLAQPIWGKALFILSIVLVVGYPYEDDESPFWENKR